jgi:hypothetical protein
MLLRAITFFYFAAAKCRKKRRGDTLKSLRFKKAELLTG